MECGEGGHSAPWGNWGVSSRLGRHYDGYQFPGWHPGDGWRQWNSCTGTYNLSIHFNDGWGRQKASPDDTRTHARVTRPIHDPYDRTCRQLAQGRVHTERNPYMGLWELDPWSDDDLVTTLKFRAMSVSVSCSGNWSCSGSTSWRSPTRGAANVTAQQRFRVRYRAR